MLIGTAVLFLVIGALLGALLWQRFSAEWQREDPVPAVESSLPLWDPHSVFNAMHRLAVKADRGGGVASDTIYNLSDHLLQGVLFQREGGVVGRDAIEAWLLSYVRVLIDLRGQGQLPQLEVRLDSGIHRVHAAGIVRQLVRRLQKTHMIESVKVVVEVVEARDGFAMARLEVVGDFEEMGRGGADMLSSTWRGDKRRCTCEVAVRCTVTSG